MCWHIVLNCLVHGWGKTPRPGSVAGDVDGPGEHPRAVDLRFGEHSAGEGATRGDDYGMHGSRNWKR